MNLTPSAMNKDYSIQINKKIIINEKGKFTQLCISKILYIYCDGYISSIKTKDEETRTARLLKEFEIELKDLCFFRVNRNTLVNMTHIHSYINYNKPTIVLTDGEAINISKRRLSNFLRLFKK